jgi:hypothetical protein
MPSALEAAFEQLMHSLNTATDPQIGEVLAILHRTKYTGSVALHCDRGVLKLIEIGRPIRIDLTRRPPDGT